MTIKDFSLRTAQQRFHGVTIKLEICKIYNSFTMQTLKKKVTFCNNPSIRLMYTWSYACKKARCGYECIGMACDRERFQ